MRSYSEQYQKALSKVLRAVKVEAAEMAVKLGFQRGPLLRQAILDERDWRKEREKNFEPYHLLDVDLDKDPPEVIRIACLNSLKEMLEPEGEKGVGTAEDWMDLLDEHMEALRQAVRRAAGPPSAQTMAAWTKTRAARARIADSSAK